MEKDIINKRIIAGGIIIFLLFSYLIFRLLTIQVFKHEDYNTMALRQRSKEIEIDAPRGYIFDKNLNQLTNNSTTTTIIVPNNLINTDNMLFSKILDNSNLSYMEIKNIIKENNLISEIPLRNAFDISNYSNVFIVEKINRYDSQNILSHVIGYINKADNTGRSGLELTQNEFLENSSKRSLLVEYDDKQSIIIGATEVDDIISPMEPSGIVTTIDEDIQRHVEQVMDKHNINGSVIVTEVETGGVSAMASRPNIDQENIYKFLENDDMALYNKSIQIGYPPGSIFKIVVLLAALEYDSDLINREFYCPGYEEVYGIRTKCSSEHGILNLKDAFSLSCNSAFIQIGKEIGGKRIIDMSKRLNLGKRINIGLLEEIPGNLPTEQETLGAEIANVSIGQGKILVTPLQISNLLMIITNNGIQKHIKLIEGISNDDGHIIKGRKTDEDFRVVDTAYTKIASEYLIDVIRNGTGRGIKLDENGSAGGKTGSAEAILNKEETVHGWFAGFYPAYNPKYVITVLVEEGMSGARSAAPIFEEICLNLSKIK